MPKTIPYDPSLVPGNVVAPDVEEKIRQLAPAKSPVQALQDELNEAIERHHKLSATLAEALREGTDVAAILDAIKDAGLDAAKAGEALGTARIDAEEKLAKDTLGNLEP